MNAHHHKAAFWIGEGVFDSLEVIKEFESRVNVIRQELDRGDVFEIFIEGYLATQAITQHTQHWVVGKIPAAMRERLTCPMEPASTVFMKIVAVTWLLTKLSIMKNAILNTFAGSPRF